MLLIPFAASVLLDPRKGDRIIDSCVVAGIVCIILSAIGPIANVYDLGERKGWFFSLHSAALLMIGISPFILIKFIQAHGKWKFLYAIVGTSLLATIFFTFVRSAWIGILVQIWTVIILVGRGRKFRLFMFFLLGMALSAGYVFMYSLDLEKRLADLTYEDTPFYYRHMGSGRIGFWEDILAAFWDAPFEEKIFGLGFRSGIFATEIGVGAHNDFIDILSNNGVFGVGLMIWLIVRLYKAGRRLSHCNLYIDMAWIYWGVFWTFIVVAFINGIIFYVGTMWYISTFIGLAYARLRFNPLEAFP
jgi:hypothetical protein